jgi:hypothetical protein
MTTSHVLVAVVFSVTISLMLYSLYRRTRIHKLYKIIRKDIEQSMIPGQKIYTVTARFKTSLKTVNVSEHTFNQLNINQEILF